MEEKYSLVTNRSYHMVVYTIPEEHIRREFMPKETKKILVSELEKLTNRPGGAELIKDCLLVSDPEIVNELQLNVEPEYYMDEAAVKDLMINGSLDSFLDALDFAPSGVIGIIKHLAVTMPLNDNAKREAIKQKTGFDVTKAIQHNVESQEASNDNAPQRRVQPQAPGRRAETPKYKVVTPAE